MRYFKFVIPCFLLLTMVGLEVARNVGMLSRVRIEAGMLEDITEEDSAEEEKNKVEEIKLKEQLTNDDFRYCARLREQSGNHIISIHDLNYELPVTKAVFSPPEFLFS